ncbi:Predicted integral membrane protein [Phaffia rhodozyma]|uniref:Predicted integral membrane protein n=1 Tax=Phaffia rhodozyma TaxID=264483 RepID=A0A0F7SHC8_PHARH|nr:Predicted integral membrane protein [Phaffia rhodozyma]
MSSRTSSASFLVIGMLTTGAANSLLTKWQDMECVENCQSPNPADRLAFEQPVFQSLNMFAGEMLCLLPILYNYLASPTSPFSGTTRAVRLFQKFGRKLTPGDRNVENYQALSQDERDRQEATTAAGIDDDDGDQPSPFSESEEVEKAFFGTWKMLLFFFPAFCDMTATTLMNAGLILTPVSIYQMTRGSLILFVGALSVVFLHRRLHLYQWLSLVGVMIGVTLVGLSGSLKPSNDHGEGIVLQDEENSAAVFGGILLILFAQLFTATQFVVEEKIMATHSVPPLLAVGLEGFFGFIATAIAMPILHILFSEKSDYFDVYKLYHQVTEHRLVWALSLCIMLSISSFNFFGLSVTKLLSANARSTIDTCRTLLIWAVSIGIGWEHLIFPSTILQLSGFAFLVYFTLIFNGIVQPPLKSLRVTPQGEIALPGGDDELREEVLGVTAELPAEGLAGRVGLDVVDVEQPSHESATRS